MGSKGLMRDVHVTPECQAKSEFGLWHVQLYLDGCRTHGGGDPLYKDKIFTH